MKYWFRAGGAGRVYCWGENKQAEVGQDYRSAFVTMPTLVPIATLVRQLSLGESSSCAVLETGQVLCWGSNAHGQIGDGTSYDALFPVPVHAPE